MVCQQHIDDRSQKTIGQLFAAPLQYRGVGDLAVWLAPDLPAAVDLRLRRQADPRPVLAD